MTEKSSEAWSFATARVPVKYALVRRRDGGPVAHAGVPLTGHALCGVTDINVYRQLFDPTVLTVCPECRDEAARTAREPEPSGQERLHDMLEPAEGSLPDELRRLLRAGAYVGPWIAGLSQTLARHVVSDQIIEGADAMHQALAAGGVIELVWAKDGGRRFLVLAPRGGTPVVAVLRADAEPRF